MKTSFTITADHIDMCQFGVCVCGLYLLLIDSCRHLLNSQYRRTAAGLEVCASIVVWHSNLADEHARALSSLMAMIMACKELQSESDPLPCSACIIQVLIPSRTWNLFTREGWVFHDGTDSELSRSGTKSPHHRLCYVLTPFGALYICTRTNLEDFALNIALLSGADTSPIASWPAIALTPEGPLMKDAQASDRARVFTKTLLARLRSHVASASKCDYVGEAVCVAKRYHRAWYRSFAAQVPPHQPSRHLLSDDIGMDIETGKLLSGNIQEDAQQLSHLQLLYGVVLAELIYKLYIQVLSHLAYITHGTVSVYTE